MLLSNHLLPQLSNLPSRNTATIKALNWELKCPITNVDETLFNTTNSRGIFHQLLVLLSLSARTWST